MNVRDVSDWWSRHPMAGDAFWAVIVAPTILIASTDATLAATNGLLGLGLSLLLLVPMLWRRRHPDVLAAAALVVHLVLLVVSDRINPLSISVPFVLYAVAAYSRHRWYRAWLVVALLGGVLAGLRWSAAESGLGRQAFSFTVIVIFCTAVVAASWVGGELARQRRRNVEALRDRADALERERDQRTRLAATEERSRIAREMHDIVAHNLSVIVVQADGARYAASHGTDPATRAELAARALEVIGDTARQALDETRRLVGVLRADDVAPEYAPQATLAQIPELVARMNDAGVPATYDVSGTPEAHPPLGHGAQMAAYRVVQEALTNAVKHGGPGVRVRVALEHQASAVVVTVRDDGAGSGGGDRTDGAGHGLIGMRERVAAYGGTLLARDRMAGGFEVVATLPTAATGAGTDARGEDAR